VSDPLPGVQGFLAPFTVIVIDYFELSAHGLWVSNLIQSIAPNAVVDERALDTEPLLALLGEDVNDAHLLANFCSLRDEIEFGDRQQKPGLINLSVARHWFDDDPTGADTSRCGPGLRCHLARLLEWFNTPDEYGRSVIVTAAGNHAAPTFPASLESTLSVGAIDINRLKADSDVRPLPESGPADALLPAQNLCTSKTATPFGTSFSCAFLTGALAANEAQIAVPTSGSIGLSSDADQCFRLTYDRAGQGECIPGVAHLFNGILGGVDPERETCLRFGETRPYPLNVGQPTDPPQYQSLQIHNAYGVNPQPEGGYCVPCAGSPLNGGGYSDTTIYSGDLRINTSETLPIGSDTAIDAMFYRYSDGGVFIYQEIEVDSGFLSDFGNGLVDQITLVGIDIPLDQQPAIEFVMRPSGLSSCTTYPNECWKSSIPIQIFSDTEGIAEINY